MRRLAAAIACATALAGCSSDGTTIYEQLGPLVQDQLLGGTLLDGDAAAPAAAQRELTRAELNQIPFATISLRQGDNPRAFVVPVADNGGFLVYQDVERRGIVMEGGLITGTRGFGYDLDAVAHRIDDPVVVPTPLPEWPAGVERSYGFTLRGVTEYDIAVSCTFERGVREFIEIVELRFEVVRVIETCRNPRRTFVNTYWVDPDSGFVWKSEQWVGPRVPPMTVEIVRPYARS